MTHILKQLTVLNILWILPEMCWFAKFSQNKLSVEMQMRNTHCTQDLSGSLVCQLSNREGHMFTYNVFLSEFNIPIHPKEYAIVFDAIQAGI